MSEQLTSPLSFSFSFVTRGMGLEAQIGDFEHQQTRRSSHLREAHPQVGQPPAPREARLRLPAPPASLTQSPVGIHKGKGGEVTAQKSLH